MRRCSSSQARACRVLTPCLTRPSRHARAHPTAVSRLKIQGFESLVDMEGELARRCDARARTAYLLDPQARVLARWRRLNLDEVGKAMARSGAQGAGEPAG